MSSDRFLAVLRAEGLTVIGEGNWREHNRNHKGLWGPVHGVMIHHTVTRGHDQTISICRNGYASLPGPLCHGVICKQGHVHLVGYGRANHAGLGDGDVLRAVIAETPLPADKEANTDGNRHFYGFECENLGDGQDPWPPEQLLAIEKVGAALTREHGWNERSVIGHLEWQPGKVDPRGFTMASMRSRIAARLDGNPQQEDDMPEYVNLGLAKPYSLRPGAWDSIEFTKEWTDEPDHHASNGSVWARGPARFTGSVSLYITGLPVGAVVQVRMSEYEGDRFVQDHPIHEVVGTAGGTFAVVPLTKRLGKGRGMRVRLLNQSKGPVTVSSSVLTVLTWKES